MSWGAGPCSLSRKVPHLPPAPRLSPSAPPSDTSSDPCPSAALLSADLVQVPKHQRRGLCAEAFWGCSPAGGRWEKWEGKQDGMKKRAGRSDTRRNRGVPATSLGGVRGSRPFANLLTASFPAGPGLAALHGPRPAGQGQAAVDHEVPEGRHRSAEKKEAGPQEACPPFRWTGSDQPCREHPPLWVRGAVRQVSDSGARRG